MATIEAPTSDLEHDPLIERARRAGFELAVKASETGQSVWEWRRGDEPRPQFVAERVARHWMYQWLDQFESGNR